MTADLAPPAEVLPDGAPRRVLVLSADMGGGHNATAAALEETVGRLWPGSEIRRLDTLDVLGPGVGRLFRRIYVANVETTPWLYEFFYASLWRHRWFAQASKRLTGSWCGRRLVTHIDRFDPSLILSTYPLGSSGLAWLHRHRGLSVATAAYVSDFAPHPFWVYPDLDANFVMHEAAVPLARAAEPQAVVGVCAPPVVSSFQPRDRQAARTRTGLQADAFVVLVSCGAYAFGDVEATVRALLRAAPQVQVVAACGRNDVTRRRLERLGLPADRLVPLGWTGEMADYVTAADVVLTNAGGATALEALASGRPVLMSRPIAAHGAANAQLMVVSGLADLCADEERLVAYIGACAHDRSGLRDLEQRAVEQVRGHDLTTGLRGLSHDRTVGSSGRRDPHDRRDQDDRRDRRDRRAWPMRASDAFFAYVDNAEVGQDVGAVMELDEVSPGRRVALADIRRQFEARLPGLPPMWRSMVGGRRPGWVLHDRVDVADHVIERITEPGESVADALDRYLSEQQPPGQPPWQFALIHGPDERRTLLVVKLHHSHGDGISALGLLDRLLTTDPADPLVERTTAPSRADPTGRQERTRAATRAARQARLLVVGLLSLALRGRPPAHPLNRPVRDAQRRLATVALPAGRLRRLAEHTDARGHEVALALVADAMGRALGRGGLVNPAWPLRVMVPVAMRPPRLDRIFGNWTGSVALDLPLEPMAFRSRLVAVRQESRLRLRRGEPHAAEAVMHIAGRLPSAAHAKLARLVYTDRFFNTIVSYMPFARGPRWCAGARVRATYPVLPLAERVPLTVGVVLTGEAIGIGVLFDPVLGLERDAVAAAVQEAFEAAEREVG